jgi:hypothetical protein
MKKKSDIRKKFNNVETFDLIKAYLYAVECCHGKDKEMIIDRIVDFLFEKECIRLERCEVLYRKIFDLVKNNNYMLSQSLSVLVGKRKYKAYRIFLEELDN